MGFLVVMVDSGRTGPLHLSAGSTSTGSNNLSGNRPIAGFGCSLGGPHSTNFLKVFLDTKAGIVEWPSNCRSRAHIFSRGPPRPIRARG